MAAEAAIALKADKLIFLMDPEGVEKRYRNDAEALLLRELTVAEGRALLEEAGSQAVTLSEDVELYLPFALHACERGVSRVHLISRHVDGGPLLELFTHSGIGTMISEGPLQNLRDARIEDVGAILQLIEPLEADGTLVRRNRELLEMEIARFVVVEHDNIIIGCAALYPFRDDDAAELACLTVHPDYRSAGCGDALLRNIESKARSLGSNKLFVLTTRTAHWFVEHGFVETGIGELPRAKQGLYNYQRRSKVFVKQL